jgi:lysyl-tRNA synthetase class 2
MSVNEAFIKYAGFALTDGLTREALVPIAQKKGYKVEDGDTWEEIYNQIFLNEVEHNLGRGKPTIIYDYPAELAALSRKKQSDPRFAERFEFYIEGLELGDGYGELTDWKEQEKRFETEAKERKRLGKTEHPIDHDFIEALKVGMPPSGGIAVGIDRLIMLFADVTDIADTLLFPAKEFFQDA